MKGWKVKTIGILMLVTAIAGIGVDALNGEGFDWAANLARLDGALAGVGLVYIRRLLGNISTVIGAGK